MEDFSLITEQDRRDISYAACVAAPTVVGLAYGSAVPLPGGAIAGAAYGLMIGLLACKRLSPLVERKLFSKADSLSDAELSGVLIAIRDQTGVENKSDAMYLLTQARAAAISRHERVRTDQASQMHPRIAASQLLSRRS